MIGSFDFQPPSPPDDEPDYVGYIRLEGAVDGKRHTTKGDFHHYAIYLYGHPMPPDWPEDAPVYVLQTATGPCEIAPRKLIIQRDGLTAYLEAVWGGDDWTLMVRRLRTCTRRSDEDLVWRGRDVLSVIMCRAGRPPGDGWTADEVKAALEDVKARLDKMARIHRPSSITQRLVQHWTGINRTWLSHKLTSDAYPFTWRQVRRWLEANAPKPW